VRQRSKVYAAVALAAIAAATAVVGVVLITRSNVPTRSETAKGPPGAPPIALDLGVRDDPEARALLRAAALYGAGRRTAAARIFVRYDSLQARVGAALAAWRPDEAARRAVVRHLDAIARARPRSAFVQLHLGLARLSAGDARGAFAAWRAAARRDPDSPSAVEADTLLHPNSPRGLPAFVPGFAPPKGLERLAPARQLAVLAAAARKPDVRAKLLYGVALQRLERPLSAEREYAAAAALAPNDAEAQVAAAVGRFEKDHPERAFSRLGPLVRRFPRAPTVRFHLGLLLLWLGRVDAARTELRRARAEGPSTPLGREASSFLSRLEGVRTVRTK
jgi:tetratricopeptide (TPR) repeat protein